MDASHAPYLTRTFHFKHYIRAVRYLPVLDRDSIDGLTIDGHVLHIPPAIARTNGSDVERSSCA